MQTNQALILSAIKQFKQIKFVYEGHPRTVNVHHLGLLGGEVQIHAYQVSDGSQSKHIPSWKNFRVNHMTNVEISAHSFHREKTYHPENANYTEIFAQIAE